MRRLLLIAALAGCGDTGSDSEDSTSTTPGGETGDNPTTGVPSGPCASKQDCEGDADCQDGMCQPRTPCPNGDECPTDWECVSGVCQECVDTSECAADEFCWAGDCLPKQGLGEVCISLENGCASGACAQVGEEMQCVEPCAHEQEPEPPVGPFTFPPYECSPGFLCIGRGQNGGFGADWFCLPEDAIDLKGVGEPCGTDSASWAHSDPDCVTSWCGWYGTCQWNCQPRAPDMLSEWPCPIGMKCVESASSMGDPGGPCTDMNFQDPFEHYSLACECAPL